MTCRFGNWTSLNDSTSRSITKEMLNQIDILKTKRKEFLDLGMCYVAQSVLQNCPENWLAFLLTPEGGRV